MRSECFRTSGQPSLRVNLPAGEVLLETGDTAETRVELEGPHEDEALIEVRGSEVVVDVERRRLFGSGRGHRLAIHAPHGASVDATTASADVGGRGRFGSVKVRTASGDVSFGEIDGDADVTTASGDVRLAAVAGGATVHTASGDAELGTVGGKAAVHSASGDVRLGEAGGAVTVRTASGDQHIGSVAQGEVTLQSASGDLEVGIRRGSSVWVDARSMSGETTSELDLGDAPPEDGGPHVEVRVTAMSGDIRIKRA